MPASSVSSTSTQTAWSRLALLVLLLTVCVLLVQSLTLVWLSDVGDDPDEPAHAVTSLMVRDYLASGFGQSPMAFAQAYYDHFPKVALGHYPPGYYGLGGGLLLIWPDPRALLILQAVLAGLLGGLVFIVGKRVVRPGAAVAAAVMTVAFPITLKLSQQIMADLLLACLCMVAVETWIRYMERPRVTAALGFGLAAAAAILTKGSGLALAMVPAVSLLGSRQWALLKKLSFWMAGLPVLVLALPWMAYSAGITKEGMVSGGMGAYFWGALKNYPAFVVPAFGLLPALVALAGLVVWLGGTKARVKLQPTHWALLGLLAGTALIMLFIPTGYSSRYFMPVSGVVALLGVSFFDVPLARTRLYMPAVVALTLLTVFQALLLPVRKVSGYSQSVIQEVDALQEGQKEEWLVCGDPRGEGAVIAAAAFALPDRTNDRLKILRATKSLINTDWLGRDIQPVFEDAESVSHWLEVEGVDRVFVDTTRTPFQTQAPAHEILLLDALRGDVRWKWVRDDEIQRRDAPEFGRLSLFVREKFDPS